jgi:hypothetical protein
LKKSPNWTKIEGGEKEQWRCEMEETRHQKFLREIMGDDMEFYEKFLKDLPDEKLQQFLDENPEFLKE